MIPSHADPFVWTAGAPSPPYDLVIHRRRFYQQFRDEAVLAPQEDGRRDAFLVIRTDGPLYEVFDEISESVIPLAGPYQVVLYRGSADQSQREREYGRLLEDVEGGGGRFAEHLIDRIRSCKDGGDRCRALVSLAFRFPERVPEMRLELERPEQHATVDQALEVLLTRWRFRGGSGLDALIDLAQDGFLDRLCVHSLDDANVANRLLRIRSEQHYGMFLDRRHEHISWADHLRTSVFSPSVDLDSLALAIRRGGAWRVLPEVARHAIGHSATMLNDRLGALRSRLDRLTTPEQLLFVGLVRRETKAPPQLLTMCDQVEAATKLRTSSPSGPTWAAP